MSIHSDKQTSVEKSNYLINNKLDSFLELLINWKSVKGKAHRRIDFILKRKNLFIHQVIKILTYKSELLIDRLKNEFVHFLLKCKDQNCKHFLYWLSYAKTWPKLLLKDKKVENMRFCIWFVCKSCTRV